MARKGRYRTSEAVWVLTAMLLAIAALASSVHRPNPTRKLGPDAGRSKGAAPTLRHVSPRVEPHRHSPVNDSPSTTLVTVAVAHNAPTSSGESSPSPATSTSLPTQTEPRTTTTTTIEVPAYHYAGYLNYPTNVTSELPIPVVYGSTTFTVSWSPSVPLVLSVSCGNAFQQAVGMSSASITMSPPSSSCVLTLSEQTTLAGPIEYEISVAGADQGVIRP
jgi:hypothetical protein